MPYNIGDFIEELNLDIIDKKLIRSKSNHTYNVYKYKCRNCGFDCGEHYIKGKKKSENWVTKVAGCGCCNSFLCAPGINNIEVTQPWMIPYFVNVDDIKHYKASSNEKVMMRCIYCGKEKLYKINDLYLKHRMTCDCYDKISMPNKFAYYTFMQIKDKINNYQREYQPEWAGRFRYDNYFEYNNKKYIVEIDGGLGHGNKAYGKDNIKDIEGLQRDKKKDKLSQNHNIILIRVDVQESTQQYLQNNLNKALVKIFGEIYINWNEVYKKCCSNEIKAVCDYYSNNINKYNKLDLINNIMTDYFCFASSTIRKYLKIGRKFGWCYYKTENEIEKERKKKNIELVCELKREHPNYTTKELSEITKLDIYLIRRYLNEGNNLELCQYNGNKELSQSRKSITYVYDKNTMELLKSYDSVIQCVERSIEDFGVKFSKSHVSLVCSKHKGYESHKGYFFSHELIEIDVNEEE